jgi:hypothetical protein
MRDFLSVLLCLMIPALAFADSGSKVTADHCKASKPGLEGISGKKAVNSEALTVKN